ncbi:hypothetical protein C8F01DRAFT_1104725 [Mycena amicta]|nr:hypothetical protein C8F01DRAFT_1104725 [Mycena amicta]
MAGTTFSDTLEFDNIPAEDGLIGHNGQDDPEDEIVVGPEQYDAEARAQLPFTRVYQWNPETQRSESFQLEGSPLASLPKSLFGRSVAEVFADFPTPTIGDILKIMLDTPFSTPHPSPPLSPTPTDGRDVAVGIHAVGSRLEPQIAYAHPDTGITQRSLNVDRELSSEHVLFNSMASDARDELAEKIYAQAYSEPSEPMPTSSSRIYFLDQRTQTFSSSYEPETPKESPVYFSPVQSTSHNGIGTLALSQAPTKSKKSATKRYRCDHADCNQTFSRANDVKRHLKNAAVHRQLGVVQDELVCPICGDSLSRLDARKRHEAKGACNKRTFRRKRIYGSLPVPREDST